MKKKLQVPVVVHAQFTEWCTPRRGVSNPENQSNDVWSWLVQTRVWPHVARRATGTGEGTFPCWCFNRFGQSETRLPDGSVVYIGGEHEDYYDPDFYIYNDVIVVHPDSSIEIYGYPTDIFPPTDFHSATLVGDDIYIIGGLRYPKDRNYQDTYVYRLSLADFSMHQVVTQGTPPRWLFKHRADLAREGNRIICNGGNTDHHPTKIDVENLTSWSFDLHSSSWSIIETKPFVRWFLMREDRTENELWEIEQIVWAANRSSRRCKHAEEYRARLEARGHTVDADLFHARFAPPFPHVTATDKYDNDDLRTHRFKVGEVIVRCVQERNLIAVTVEGELKGSEIEALQRHGVETFARLEGVPYICVLL